VRFVAVCAGFLPPGRERSLLVGGGDRLYAVTQVELLEDVGDVGLHGGLADVELS
jgi:hypothetical protein